MPLNKIVKSLPLVLSYILDALLLAGIPKQTPDEKTLIDYIDPVNLYECSGPGQ